MVDTLQISQAYSQEIECCLTFKQMKVIFTESFFDSLDRIQARNRWYWKFFDFIRYDLPTGIKNLFFFFRAVWNYRGYDYHGSLVLFRRSLEPLYTAILNGNEVEESRLKKADKIRRAIELLRRIETDDYIDLAEAHLGSRLQHTSLLGDAPGKSESNSAIFEKAHEYEKETWEELWSILKGQDESYFNPDPTETFVDAEDRWYRMFDGSGIRGWWD